MSDSLDPAAYEYSQANWTCGLKACGQACAHGPTKSGDCPEMFPCEPRRDGEGWKCTRSKLQGGACAGGPRPDGGCGLPLQRCIPVRSVRSRRGLFVFTTFAIVCGALAMVMVSPYRNELIVPGGLTTPHGQVLQTHGVNRCASCHERASGSLASWAVAAMGTLGGQAILESATRDDTTSPSQTELCLECHRQSIHPERATNPHNLSVAELRALGHRMNDPSTTDRNSAADLQLACSTCHREHHGATHDLTAMTDAQCNHCHMRPVADFAHHHPEFNGWPYQRRQRLLFTHAAHQARHFPEAETEFRCTSCHQSAGGEIVAMVDFQRGCGQCHQQKIHDSFGTGIALLNLPTLDTEFMADYGFSAGQWPQEAQGDFDGALTPLINLLLTADAEARDAWRRLGDDFDFVDVDPDDLDQLEAASDLVWAYKRLLREFAMMDAAALKQRLVTVAHGVGDAAGSTIDRGGGPERQRPDLSTPRRLDPAQAQLIEQLLSQLPFEQIKSALDHWLPELRQEFPEDPPWTPFADETAKFEPPRLGQAARRDDRLSVIYLPPEGHAGAFSRRWIELILMMQGRWSPAEVVLEQLQGAAAAGSCLHCHTVDRTTDGSLVVNWYGRSPTACSKGFTRFDHKPHLLLPELQDCTPCHQMTFTMDMGVYTGFSCDQPDGTFEPISQKFCATCHHEQSATQRCTACHNYHVRRSGFEH